MLIKQISTSLLIVYNSIQLLKPMDDFNLISILLIHLLFNKLLKLEMGSINVLMMLLDYNMR